MEILMWLLVMWMGFAIGAGIYETRVVLPLWAGSPPESLKRWHSAPFRIDPGLRFWVFCTPGLALLSLVVLVSFLGVDSPAATYVKIGAGLSVALAIWAFAWFVPRFRAVTGPKFQEMDQQQAAGIAVAWRRMNSLRVVLFLAAWACLTVGAVGMERPFR